MYWILLELRMVEVVAPTGAVRRAKLQSNCQHQQTNIQFFFTGWMPCLSPDQQYHIPSTWSAQVHLGVIQPCLWPLKAPGYLGEHCQASHQLSDDSTPACLKHYHPYNFTRGKAQWMSSQCDDLVQKTLKIQISLEIIFTSSFSQKFSSQKISVKSDRNL